MDRQWLFVGIVCLYALAGCTVLAPTDTATETPTVSPTPTSTTTGAASTPTSAGATSSRGTTPTAQTSGNTPASTPTQSPASTGQEAYQVTVIDVVDGDTLDIRYQDGTTDTVRLLGIDTPEVHTETDPSEYEGIPDTEAGRDWLRDWGHKASEFARTEVHDEEVRIVIDSQADRRGSYGRLLAYVYHDGDQLNYQLIQQGYARMYDSSFSKRNQYSDAEATAQADNVGVWGFKDSSTTPTPDGTGTESTGEEFAVTEIHEDAEGNDNENTNDEYIVFENTGDSAIDLNSWSVSDEANHTYYFPDGFVVDAGQQVTLYTGSGEDTETELYWGSNSAIWNNGGDTVTVKDETGQTVVEESY